MNHYAIAIATGLSHTDALLYATAMTHSITHDVNHLRIVK